MKFHWLSYRYNSIITFTLFVREHFALLSSLFIFVVSASAAAAAAVVVVAASFFMTLFNISSQITHENVEDE